MTNARPDIIPPEHHLRAAEALAAAVVECVGTVDAAVDVLMAAITIAIAGDRDCSSVITALRRLVNIAAASIVDQPTGAAQ